jgi:hypothetical protein
MPHRDTRLSVTLRAVQAASARQGWDEERPRRYFAQPYSLPEALAWVKHNLLGPSQRHRELTASLPPDAMLNPIEPRLTIAFVGDVLPLHGTRLEFGASLRRFLQDADVLVANFEGTVTRGAVKPVFMGQRQTSAVLDLLADLFPPERTVLTCANNHAGDYGWEQFRQSYELLRSRGFLPIGRTDQPAVVVNDEVLIACCTAWSNQPCGYVVAENEIDRLRVEVPYRILCPHWGYELQAYPHPAQIANARRLLQRWDMIAGHHSHCPQPVTSYANDRGSQLVAYSLGNCTFGYRLRHHLRGVVLKIEIGPGADGRWSTGRASWRHTEVRFRDRRRAVVQLTPAG